MLIYWHVILKIGRGACFTGKRDDICANDYLLINFNHINHFIILITLSYYFKQEPQGLNAHLSLMNSHLTQAPCGATRVCHQLEKLWKPYWIYQIHILESGTFGDMLNLVSIHVVLALGSCPRAPIGASYVIPATNYPLALWMIPMKFGEILIMLFWEKHENVTFPLSSSSSSPLPQWGNHGHYQEVLSFFTYI